MKTFKTIKGTHDLLPKDQILWRKTTNLIHKIMIQNGYGEIRTPAFEDTELFLRGMHSDRMDKPEIINMKLLIVDDERNMRESLKVVLESHGYKADTVESAEDGLVALSNNSYFNKNAKA